MDENPRRSGGIFSRRGTRLVKKKTVIIGLKHDNCSREMLLRLLNLVVVRGDSVLAVHVQQSDDTFDPNTFHIHEDICKSKQVDFEVKICAGNCYLTELTHLVRLNFATILAIGCSNQCPEDSDIAGFLKALPPTCDLLVMDNGGKILLQNAGTSQQGLTNRVLRSSFSSPVSASYCCGQPETRHLFRKFLSLPTSSTSPSSELTVTKKNHKHDHFSPKFFQSLAMLEMKGHVRRFMYEELSCATKSFSPDNLIEERESIQVYQAIGLAAVIKVIKASQDSEKIICRELEMLSGFKHENIVQLLGYCCCAEMFAIVYISVDSSLKQRLKQLIWSERMKVAVGVAKALEYLHSSYPPIIHRDLKSSNILLSKDCEPQLSEFGAAAAHDLQTEESIADCKMPVYMSGSFGYQAPEYVMYGKVDEKIDVYSYGVVILELITGNEAIRTSPGSNQECLVLWARSLLNSGLSERLIDPILHGEHDKDEMKIMMAVARLCLLHSSSRRPAMKTILRLLEEPEYWSEMQKMRDKHVNQIRRKYGAYSDPCNFMLVEDD
ncbi:probable serine/threonine-protein kinase PBL23 [Primulina huaijiensis]|uniref:probable serine/threonine-protein kinase PBL23 n=1 Tax=Primulina huaijiensis TaxID=1492673 RepID=UPI003CC76C81